MAAKLSRGGVAGRAVAVLTHSQLRCPRGSGPRPPALGPPCMRLQSCCVGKEPFSSVPANGYVVR